jgi:hypothetical protein
MRLFTAVALMQIPQQRPNITNMYLTCETIYVSTNGPFNTQLFLSGVLDEQDGVPWPIPKGIWRKRATKRQTNNKICQD